MALAPPTDRTLYEVGTTLAGPYLKARGLRRVDDGGGDVDTVRRLLREAGLYRILAEENAGPAGGAGGAGRAGGARLISLTLAGPGPWDTEGVSKRLIPGAYHPLNGRSPDEVVLVVPPVILKTANLMRAVESQRKNHKARLLLLEAYPFGMNPFDNVLVPRHELLTPREAETVLDSLDCARAGLSQMKETDPAAVWLGARPDDVVRIYRRSAAGIVPAYRVVTR